MSDDQIRLSEDMKKAFSELQRPGSSRLNNRQIVREMLPDILRKREAGWSYQEIHEEMERLLGFTGTLATLYSYVEKLARENRKQQQSASGASLAKATSLQQEPAVMPADSTASNPNPAAPPPRRRRVSDLASPEYLAFLRERAARSTETKKKPKLTMVDMVNKPV